MIGFEREVEETRGTQAYACSRSMTWEHSFERNERNHLHSIDRRIVTVKVQHTDRSISRISVGVKLNQYGGIRQIGPQGDSRKAAAEVQTGNAGSVSVNSVG
jgi:hypothetical protein